MKKFVCFYLVIIICLSCRSKDDKYATLKDKLIAEGFNVDIWKIDTLGCYQEYRIAQANILQKNRNLFEGLRIDSVHFILGNPYVEMHSHKAISWEYIVEGKDFCCPINSYIREELKDYKKRTSLDMLKIVLTFKNGDSTVTDLHFAIP